MLFCFCICFIFSINSGLNSGSKKFSSLFFSINDLAIDGNDIMRELKIKPGPKIGEILQKLFTEVDENLSRNNKEFLLKRIKELA